MNNSAFNKESSKPSKFIKQSHRVEAQLAHRRNAKSEVVPPTVTTPASAIELVPGSALPPVEKVHVERRKLRNRWKSCRSCSCGNLSKQVDRKMLGKVKRAFLKVGVEAGPEAQADFLNALLCLTVPVEGSLRWLGRRKVSKACC